MIYDISPPISKDIDVWPGDTEFEHDLTASTKSGDNITLSKITTTLHLGAHTDAPNHYSMSNQGIDTVDLNRYIGLCSVIDVSHVVDKRIKPHHLVSKNIEERILLKTSSFPNPNKWNNDFQAYSSELIDYLNSEGVILIGIDTPSIDLYDDKDLESHSKVYQYNMSILEGVVLDKVDEGMYELIALPLKIKDADASPVRAILRTL